MAGIIYFCAGRTCGVFVVKIAGCEATSISAMMRGSSYSIDGLLGRNITRYKGRGCGKFVVLD